MKPIVKILLLLNQLTATRWMTFALLLSLMFFQSHAHASMFTGETLDNVSDVMSWVVLIIAPIAAVAVFLMVHIPPEKIAEKKHPQTDAIKTLCLLSLVFGGMLWPLAWLWIYSKPVMYKLAYGTDKLEQGHDDAGVPIYQGGALNTQVEIRTVEQKEAVANTRAWLCAPSATWSAAGTTLAEREQLLQRFVTDNPRTLDLEQTSYHICKTDLRAVQQQQLASLLRA